MQSSPNRVARVGVVGGWRWGDRQAGAAMASLGHASRKGRGGGADTRTLLAPMTQSTGHGETRQAAEVTMSRQVYKRQQQLTVHWGTARERRCQRGTGSRRGTPRDRTTYSGPRWTNSGPRSTGGTAAGSTMTWRVKSVHRQGTAPNVALADKKPSRQRTIQSQDLHTKPARQQAHTWRGKQRAACTSQPPLPPPASQQHQK